MYKLFFPSGNAEQFCDHVFRNYSKLVHKANKQKKCWLEPKEKCIKLPKKECWDEPWEDCWDEKKEVCHNYSVRSCQPVPNKECVKVTVKRPREVCIPEATKTKIETKVEEW